MAAHDEEDTTGMRTSPRSVAGVRLPSRSSHRWFELERLRGLNKRAGQQECSFVGMIHDPHLPRYHHNEHSRTVSAPMADLTGGYSGRRPDGLRKLCPTVPRTTGSHGHLTRGWRPELLQQLRRVCDGLKRGRRIGSEVRQRG